MSATVSASLYQTIQTVEWKDAGICGLLVGPSHGHLVASAVWRTECVVDNRFEDLVEECLAAFPGGQRVIGIILVAPAKLIAALSSGDNEVIENELGAVCGDYGNILEHLGCESCLLLCLHRKDELPWELSSVTLGKDGVKPISLSHENDLDRLTVRMRLRAAIPLLISTESADGISNQLEVEFTKFQTMLQNGGFVYGIENNQILLMKTGLTQNGSIQKLKTCKDLQAYVQSLEEERGGGGGVGKGGNKKKTPFKQSPIPVSMLEMASSVSSSQNYAPVISHQIGTFESVQLSLPVDVLLDVSEDFPVSKLATLITGSVSRQLKAFMKCLKMYNKAGKIYSPEAFHFHPQWLDSPITVVYPQGIPEDTLEKERLALHRTFCLPTDGPYLRKSSGNIFLNPTAPGGYLLNPHIGLPDPAVKSASRSIVSGYYSYHHYMQDRFNDDKWGCAYRSLQSIISWFRYQGYTDKSIPSHKEIQQALHDVGDKPEKFVGSRQWIGSFEVSFVLDHLLGVSSKFINVNAGAELATVGQQLAHHFQVQGTPVMIGGGVLAHTILGVAYDELTGDINFLILDPHYTGGEDLRTIQSKGWCGWKDMKFWNQTAHYNMCLPQRPDMV